MREWCAWIARKMTEWPSKRGPISKIMSSDGCKGDTVPLEMGPGYDFHEVGCHLGNVGLLCYTVRRAGCINEISIELRPNTRALDRSVVARRRGKI